jgi:hypothetical protein
MTERVLGQIRDTEISTRNQANQGSPARLPSEKVVVSAEEITGLSPRRMLRLLSSTSAFADSSWGEDRSVIAGACTTAAVHRA